MKIDQEIFIAAYAKACGTEEGFFKSGKVPTIPQRLNNPLDLRSWKDNKGKPYPVVNGYAKFPDPETGWAAGRSQCRINIVKRQLTFREFFSGKRGVYAGFAPRADRNDPFGYANNVLAFVKRAFPASEEVQAATIDTVIATLVNPAAPK